MFMDGLTWESKLWYPPGQGTGVSYQEADISHRFRGLALDGYQVKLCRWPRTYSILVYRRGEDRPSTGLKQIPIAEFNKKSEEYLQAASRHFERILPPRHFAEPAESALRRSLMDVLEKHWQDDEAFLW